MRLPQIMLLRISQGFSLTAVGAKEARIAFDAAVAMAATILAVAFGTVFLSTILPVADILRAAVVPVLFIAFNALLGLYSRFRLSRARTKAVLLAASVTLTCGSMWVFLENKAIIVLWAMMAIGPLVLARLLLIVQTGRHKALARIASPSRRPVLVIGGAGYIGSHTVDLLLEAGYEVRVLDRLMYGRQPLEDFVGNPRFSIIEGDVTDIAKLTAAMKDCSAVVHLAGLVGDPACAVNPEFTRHTNIVATRMAKEVAQAMGIERFVFASSCSVYGVSDAEVAETDSLNPVSLYAQTKIDSEQELLVSPGPDFSVTILRFATVFGHSRRPRFDLVGNLFTAQAMTDGLITVVGPGQWRPFIHVRDVARAIAAVLKAPTEAIRGQVFNVGDKRLNMTILQLAERVRDVASEYREAAISVTDNPSDRRNYSVSFEKIKKTLSFQAQHSIETGVTEIVRHFLDGAYGHYRSPAYSNVVMTAKALSDFQDPAQMARLYAPLGAVMQPSLVAGVAADGNGLAQYSTKRGLLRENGRETVR